MKNLIASSIVFVTLMATATAAVAVDVIQVRGQDEWTIPVHVEAFLKKDGTADIVSYSEYCHGEGVSKMSDYCAEAIHDLTKLLIVKGYNPTIISN